MSYISDMLCAERNGDWEEARAIRRMIEAEDRADRESFWEDDDYQEDDEE